jgi:hypothetical protein
MGSAVIIRGEKAAVQGGSGTSILIGEPHPVKETKAPIKGNRALSQVLFRDHREA